MQDVATSGLLPALTPGRSRPSAGFLCDKQTRGCRLQALSAWGLRPPARRGAWPLQRCLGVLGLLPAGNPKTGPLVLSKGELAVVEEASSGQLLPGVGF